MNIWQAYGKTMQRTDDVIEYIRTLLIPETASILSDVQPALQEWGTQAIHFTAKLLETDSPIIIKVGISPTELFYARQLAQQAPDFVPAIFASSDQLAEHSISWAIFEQIPYGPFGPLWEGREFDLMIEAGVKFQQLATKIESPKLPQQNKAGFRHQLKRGIKQNAPCPTDKILQKFDQQWDWLEQVCSTEICHGDLHLGNGLSRYPAPSGPAVLIDFSPVYQPWCFDAAYLQALSIGNKNRRNNTNLVKKMARLRSDFGLSTIEGADLDKVQTLTVGWFALAHWQPERQTHFPYYRVQAEELIQKCSAVN